MYLVPTKHYKLTYPLDAGGLVFGGPFPKFVEDDFGGRVAAQNFPYVVPCDKDGKYLVEVPPVKILTFVDESAKDEQVSLPQSMGQRLVAGKEAYPTDDELQGEDPVQPVVEEVVTTKSSKKGK